MDRIEAQPTDKTPARPWTPDKRVVHPDGRVSTRLHVKRCCNGCGREIGDVTRDEISRAIDGLPLPDVRHECGCAAAGGTS